MVYVRYRDHILFRNSKLGLYEPTVRETVGWIYKESDEAIWILWDKSNSTLPHERIQPRESGLVILKAEIMELRRLEMVEH